MYDNQAKTLEEIKNAKEMYIHEGIFHMDDVLCAALVKKINPNIKIIRDRDNIPENTTAVICDCYGGYFDHHFNNPEDIKQRDNGQKMASMGCLMQVVGQKIFGDKWKEIDEKIISRFDAADLGIEGEFLSGSLSKLNPAYKQNESIEGQFEKALNNCNKLIDSLNNENKIEVNFNKLLEKYFEDKNLTDDMEVNLLEYLEKSSSFIYKELQDENSCLRIYLSGLSEEEQFKAIEDILDTEKRTLESNKLMQEETEKDISLAISEKKECAIFDSYPGNANVFSDTNVKFVIFPQTGTTKYCINIVGETEKADNGFPDAKIPFPKEYIGKDIVIKKELEKSLPLSKEIINEYLVNNSNNLNINLLELSQKLSSLLNRKIEITNEEQLFNFKNSIDSEIKRKTELLKTMKEKGIEFVHPGRFFVQATTKESAIAFVEEILQNEDYIKQAKIEQISGHLNKWFEKIEKENISITYNSSEGEIKKIENSQFYIDLLDEKNSSIEYINEMSKLIKLCINENYTIDTSDVILLSQTKNSKYEITGKIKDIIKAIKNEEIEMPITLKEVKLLIDSNISSKSIDLFLEDFPNLKPEEINTEIKLLQIVDKYDDKDLDIAEIKEDLNKEMKDLNLTENIKNLKAIKEIQEPENIKEQENILET